MGGRSKGVDANLRSGMLVVVVVMMMRLRISNADELYGSPQSYTCNQPSSTCYGYNISCPYQCPSFKPADPTAKACVIHCNSPKCEAYCKNRTANCDGVGSACGDPRFVGGDGIVFYFHGKRNEHFSLVSDRNFQINAHFIGIRPQGRKRDNTWIQALGLMFGRHAFTLEANKRVPKWDETLDQLRFTYDGQPLHIPEGHLSSWTAPNTTSPNLLTVERTGRANSVTVVLDGVAEISVSVVPISKQDDRIHKYGIPFDRDCFPHLQLQFRFFRLSDQVEGVLGQTYRPDFHTPVKSGVAMPIMGGDHHYKTSSLVSTHCNLCVFSPHQELDVPVKALHRPDPINIMMECTSNITNGRGVVCRR